MRSAASSLTVCQGVAEGVRLAGHLRQDDRGAGKEWRRQGNKKRPHPLWGLLRQTGSERAESVQKVGINP